jgi:hypothetical protein
MNALQDESQVLFLYDINAPYADMYDAFLSIEFSGSQQAKHLVYEDVCRCSHRNHPTGFHRLKRVFVLLKANAKVSHDGQV